MAISRGPDMLSELTVSNGPKVLPHGWFVNPAPEVRSDYKTGKWFVPLDIMLGRKLGRRWVTSIEYRYGLISGVDSYKNWIEARVGYFF